VVAISPWVFPGSAGLGQLSQTSDRLYSCGFPDRQSRPWSATGAGGFEVLIANCKLRRHSQARAGVLLGTWRHRVANTSHCFHPSFAVRVASSAVACSTIKIRYMSHTVTLL
jgi:hypothetical protein